MNGKAAKRVRKASMISHRSVKQLKKEYKQNPYHCRKLIGNIKVRSHSEMLKYYHKLREQYV